MLRRTVSCPLVSFLFILFLVNTNCWAQDNDTIKADELINIFSPKKNTIEQEQDQPESSKTRSLSRSLGRGLGGIREGHSNPQPQIDPDSYPPPQNQIQPSQNVPQQIPQAIQQVNNYQPEVEVRKSFQNILFDVNAYTIKDSSYSQLDEIGKALKVVMSLNPDSFFIIEGHTDDKGSAEYNEKLSTRRAEMVRDFLLFKYDLDARRLMALGYGENKPIASNENEFGRSLNRRVEIVKR